MCIPIHLLSGMQLRLAPGPRLHITQPHAALWQGQAVEMVALLLHSAAGQDTHILRLINRSRAVSFACHRDALVPSSFLWPIKSVHLGLIYSLLQAFPWPAPHSKNCFSSRKTTPKPKPQSSLVKNLNKRHPSYHKVSSSMDANTAFTHPLPLLPQRRKPDNNPKCPDPSRTSHCTHRPIPDN